MTLLFLGLSVSPSMAANIGVISSGTNVVLANNEINHWANDNDTQKIAQVDSQYDATLAANTTVRFDISVTTGSLVANGYAMTLSSTPNTYGAMFNGSWIGGGTQAALTLGPNQTGSSNGTAWGDPSALLTTSLVVLDSQHAYILISNNAPISASIMARLQTYLSNDAASTLKITYTTVSAVPLPAALPLMGLGLAGLAAARKKRAA